MYFRSARECWESSWLSASCIS